MAKSIYIHWPFCARKCPYCDFNSHVRNTVDVAAWQNALLSDMRFEADQTEQAPLKSIFFGGGTPSLMPPELVDRLLTDAEKIWGFAPDIEITLEANPSSVEASRFGDLASAGVNRVSLGIQSLEDSSLQFLGRLHSASEALEALEIAKDNFARVSFDLIYALPGQTDAEWREQLTRALSFETDHLSLYQLTIEPSTRFATDVRRGTFTPLDDDNAGELFEITQEMTAAAGLPAYEISNHARLGQESRHNLTYWRYEDYIGIGPGAHGRRGNVATERTKKPENYLEQSNLAGGVIQVARNLTPKEQLSESLLMGLRLTEGMDLQRLETRFGIPIKDILVAGKLQLHVGLGLMWEQSGKVGATPKGMPLLDALLADLVPSDMVLEPVSP